MKNRAHKIFWGILLLLTAAVMLLHGVGFGGEALGIPLYKIVLGIVIISLILSKLIFTRPLREKFRIFIYASLLFMIFEKEIANYLALESENIINNWVLLGAAILIEIAIGFIFPKRTEKGYSNSFSASTKYFDVSQNNQFWVYNKFGATEVYLQNTELADPNVPIELNVTNRFGALEIHVPNDWVVQNDVQTKLSAVDVALRNNQSNNARLIVKGTNSLGAVEITSP